MALIKVFNIKDPANCPYTFRDYDKELFNLNDYQSVFVSNDELNIEDNEADRIEVLEYLFELFNLSGPEKREELGFRGHSLSVSDVVKIDDNFYYCNNFGWKKIN